MKVKQIQVQEPPESREREAAQSFKSNTPEINFKQKKRNRIIFQVAYFLGFSMPGIRRGLLAMNEIRQSDLVDGRASAVTMTRTIAGDRGSDECREILARKLDLTIGELFPGDYEPKPQGP